MDLIQQIDKTKIPNHVAIIMDGNGRWAKERGLSRMQGHRQGIETVKKIAYTCLDLNVKILTLYAFSTENWKRPKLEVNHIMGLLRTIMPTKIDEFNRNKVRINTIGRTKQLSFFVRRAINKTIKSTRHNTDFLLNFAINYGGRNEIVDGIKACVKNKKFDIIDKDDFNSMLYHPNLPDVDLLIRTADTCRISNFMLWHIPYTEIFFSKVMWPDFKEEHLYEAVLEYQRKAVAS